MVTIQPTKPAKKKSSPMMNAAVALLDAGSYYTGHDKERFVFAGKHERGCAQLVDAGLAENHPDGLMIFKQQRQTLTSKGWAIGRQMYRLTNKGKEAAETYKNALKEQADGEARANVQEGGLRRGQDSPKPKVEQEGALPGRVSAHPGS